MGQYHYIINLDKREYLHPHRFGDGLKLLEFGASGEGTMLGLALLLAKDNGRGGGDLRSNAKIIGSWAGDRIVIAGDCGDKTETIDGTPVSLHELASAEYEEISERVLDVLSDDAHLDELWRCVRGRDKNR